MDIRELHFIDPSAQHIPRNMNMVHNLMHFIVAQFKLILSMPFIVTSLTTMSLSQSLWNNQTYV